LRFKLETPSLSLAALGVAILLTAGPAAAQSGAPVELSGFPYRMNDNGEIAGWVFVGANISPAIYRAGGWQDLGVPAGDQLGVLFGINGQGATVGWSFFTDGAPPPNTDNRWSAIEAPAGAASTELLSELSPDSFAYAINDGGSIVGCRSRYDDNFPDPNRAFLLASGGVNDLHATIVAAARPGNPSPGGDDQSCAFDINATGDVVGYVSLTGDSPHGFLYRAGVVTVLTRDVQTFLLNAKAVNDAGKVVGDGMLPGFAAAQALAYDANTRAISSLGLEARGASTSTANDVNNGGDVVGTMTISGQDRAFLAAAGQSFDLNTLLPPGSDWVLQQAYTVNRQRQIAGVGYRTGSPGTTRYFLWTVTLTPTQLVNNLIQAVRNLVSTGTLSSGNGNALIVKLEAVLTEIAAGNVGGAISRLQSFISQVAAFVQTGKLSAAQGQVLIGAANGIIAALTR
jgi:probable HAF family extracellular repeat protein